MKPSVYLQEALHNVWRSKGVASTLLWPLSWLVRAGIARKHARYQRQPHLVHHSSVPVVVVGNIYVGGTGKTPVVIALVEALRGRGWQPGVVSRGYGVKIGKHARTGQGELDPAQFGDEPALIAQATHAPIAVHPDRALALKKLLRAYPHVDVVVSDDGLQHLGLGRDLEIVVQDARGTGNGRVLPAGPLREPASRLKYVDIIVTNLQAGHAALPPVDTPARQLTMRLKPARAVQLTSGLSLEWTDWLERHKTEETHAVAAIGQPERFFSMLTLAGVQLTNALALPDHDAYKQSPFADLTAAVILITAKDAVKCRRFNDPRLWVVETTAEFSDPAWLDHVNDMLRIIAQHKAAMAQGPGRH